MEKYYGSTLMFKTPKCNLKGVLKSIDYTTNSITIQELDCLTTKKINILDIEELQIIEMPKQKPSYIKSSAKLNESLLEMRIKEKSSEKRNDMPQKMRSIVSNEVYAKAMNDTFYCYGPSEECLFYNVSKIVHNFLYKQRKESWTIIVNESFYARIGLHLCQMFRKSSFNFNATYSVQNDARYSKEIQYYKNNGGKFADDTKQCDNIVLLGRTNKTLRYTKNCYIFDIEDGRGYENTILFMLGMVRDSFSTFNGQIYLIDCNLSQSVYEKYGIKNKCNGDILQIKK